MCNSFLVGLFLLLLFILGHLVAKSFRQNKCTNKKKIETFFKHSCIKSVFMCWFYFNVLSTTFIHLINRILRMTHVHFRFGFALTMKKNRKSENSSAHMLLRYEHIFNKIVKFYFKIIHKTFRDFCKEPINGNLRSGYSENVPSNRGFHLSSYSKWINAHQWRVITHFSTAKKTIFTAPIALQRRLYSSLQFAICIRKMMSCKRLSIDWMLFNTV